MTTDPAQEEPNEEQPVAETPEAAAEATAEEAPAAARPADAAESDAPLETPDVETPAVDSDAGLEVPSSDLPELTLGSGEPGVGESVVDPNYQPTIRGKIDRFGVAMGTGRRKTSVARVRIKDGSGAFTINGRPMEQFLSLERNRNMVVAPLKLVEKLGKVDVAVRVQGGGTTGQTGAIVLGIARALQGMNEAWHPTLADAGFLTRDDRMVERKKFGLRKARRSYQFSKR
jgi:small subunit ribosomal protein S9